MGKARDLLGFLPPSWASYILHMRPRAFGIVAAHFSVGAILASGNTSDRQGDIMVPRHHLACSAHVCWPSYAGSDLRTWLPD